VLNRLGAAALGGFVAGIVVGGIGGRLAMFVLRLTSSDAVRGIETDDGFEIGEFSGNTFFLVLITALGGMLFALLYLAVRRWLPEPWRPLLMALFFGAAGGAAIIEPGKLDFTLLDPLWLAVTMFVVLPAAYGALMVVAVEWLLAEPQRWRRLRVAALVVFLVLGSFGLIGIAVALIAALGWFAARRWPAVADLSNSSTMALAVRSVLVLLTAFAAVTLIGDAAEIL
jgi:hypothetical protein